MTSGDFLHDLSFDFEGPGGNVQREKGPPFSSLNKGLLLGLVHSHKHAELDDAVFDILFLTGTWRQDKEEIVETPSGCMMRFSGGESCYGVGIVMPRRCRSWANNLCFQAYSSRACCR